MIDQTSYHSIDYLQRAYYNIEHKYKYNSIFFLVKLLILNNLGKKNNVVSNHFSFTACSLTGLRLVVSADKDLKNNIYKLLVFVEVKFCILFKIKL